MTSCETTGRCAMPDYDRCPTTFDGLLDAAKGQLARMTEPDYDPRIDGVVMHPAAMVELLEMVRYCAMCHA